MGYMLELGLCISMYEKDKDRFKKLLKIFLNKEKITDETNYLTDLFRLSNEITQDNIYYIYISDTIKVFTKFDQYIQNIYDFCTEYGFGFIYAHVGDDVQDTYSIDNEYDMHNIHPLNTIITDSKLFEKVYSQRSVCVNF